MFKGVFSNFHNDTAFILFSFLFCSFLKDPFQFFSFELWVSTSQLCPMFFFFLSFCKNVTQSFELYNIEVSTAETIYCVHLYVCIIEQFICCFISVFKNFIYLFAYSFRFPYSIYIFQHWNILFQFFSYSVQILKCG